jgi:hypothetical protein
MTLDDVIERLESTDLIPSHQPLLQGIEKKFAQIKKAGISSVELLRAKLKTAKSLAATAAATRIEPDYLALLRRAIEGFFPKPLPLRSFDWLASSPISKLEAIGVANTQALHAAVGANKTVLLKKSGISAQALSELAALSDLVRIQWVSPTFARVLLAVGCKNAKAVAVADPEELFAAVSEANAGSKYYEGKIGLRDIKRLVAAAVYVPA